MKSRRRRYVAAAFLLGLVLGAAVSLLAEVFLPHQIPGTAVSSFFATSAGVSATILVAMSVSSFSILRAEAQADPDVRRFHFAAVIGEMVVAFVGLVGSAVEILFINPSPASTYSVTGPVVLIVWTWLMGFSLMCLGLASARNPKAQSGD